MLHSGDAFAGKSTPIIDGDNGGSALDFGKTLAKACRRQERGHDHHRPQPADEAGRSDGVRRLQRRLRGLGRPRRKPASPWTPQQPNTRFRTGIARAIRSARSGRGSRTTSRSIVQRARRNRAGGRVMRRAIVLGTLIVLGGSVDGRRGLPGARRRRRGRTPAALAATKIEKVKDNLYVITGSKPDAARRRSAAATPASSSPTPASWSSTRSWPDGDR